MRARIERPERLSHALRRGVAAAALCAAGLVAVAPIAWAQSPPEEPGDAQPARAEPGPGETVRERARPEYDPIGVRLGGFFLYPEFTVSELYRDNIFYTEDNAESDFITVLSPSARLASNWSRHELTLSASVDQGLYADNSDENYLDASFAADGRLDVQQDLALTGGASAARLHEERSSPDQAGAAEPVTYWRYGADAGVAKSFNRLRTSAGVGVDVYRYDSVDAVGGGVFTSDDRDRRETEGRFQIGYALSSRIEPYVRATANQRRYADDGAVNRDSDGWEGVVGAAFDLGGVTTGEVYAGYLEQTYDDPSLGKISGPSFGGALTWNPTGLTTVELSLDRTVAETTLSGASGALRTGGSASIDHELRRNVIVGAEASYAVVDYESIQREDDTASGGLDLTYLFTRNFSARAGYQYERRRSSVSNADYDVKTLLLSVSAKL